MARVRIPSDSLRDAVREMGAPLYVPGGRFGDWKLSGHGGGGSVNRILVSASADAADDDRRATLEIETTTRPDQTWPSWLVSRVLTRSVPHDISFPWTVTVDQHDVAISVDEAAVPFTLIDTGTAWLAFATVGERWVFVEGCDTPIEDVELRRIDDVENLPDDHFPTRT
jgi:hypothetical protein